MRQVYFPIQPRPAYWANTRSLKGSGVDVGAGVERLRRLDAHPRKQRIETLFQDVVVVVAPGSAK